MTLAMSVIREHSHMTSLTRRSLGLVTKRDVHGLYMCIGQFVQNSDRGWGKGAILKRIFVNVP